MANSSSVSPFALDAYSTRAKRTKRIYTPDNPYARKVTNAIAILLFVAIDFATLFTVWNLVMLENPFYIICICAGCAVALDVPLAIGANALKKYHHGFMKKNEAMISMLLSVIVFAIAFAFSLGFRLVTKDLSFDVGTSSTLISTIGETANNSEGNASIWFAALFNGILPLLTSLSSFVISYFSTDPVNDKLRTLETERITLQANLIEADTALAQGDDAITHCNGLLARERDLYTEFIEKLNAENQTLKQLARIVLMEKLGGSNDITALTESGERIYEELQHLDVPGTNLASFIDEKFSNNENQLVAENKIIA